MALQCERQFIILTMCPLWMAKSLFVQFWFCGSCLEKDWVYLPLTWIFMRILNMWFSHLLLSSWVFKGKELKSNTYHLKHGFIRSYWKEQCVFFLCLCEFHLYQVKYTVPLNPISGHSCWGETCQHEELHYHCHFTRWINKTCFYSRWGRRKYGHSLATSKIVEKQS